MGGKNNAQTIGYRQKLGFLAVLGLGIYDKVVELRVDGLVAWIGNGIGRFDVDAPELFGGDDGEGGWYGPFKFQSGALDQTVDTYLATHLAAPTPAHRGLGTIIAKHPILGNNPYIKAFSFVAQRIFVRHDGTAQWYPEKAAIAGDAIYRTETSPGQALALSYTPTVAAGQTSGTALVFDDPVPPLQVHGLYFYRTDTETVDGIVLTPATDGYWLMDGAGTVNTTTAYAYIDMAVYGTAYRNARLRVMFDGARSNVIAGSGVTWRLQASSVGVDSETPYASAVFTDFAAAASGIAEPQNWTAVDSGFQDAPDNRRYLRIAIESGNEAYIRDIRIELEADPGVTALDMNPAHIIREVLTMNASGFGLGEPEAKIDATSFTAAADQLYTEGFGLSMTLDDTAASLSVIQAVQSHIDAVSYTHRSTGLWTLKLIRDDYDVADIPALTDAHIISLNTATEVPEELPNRLMLKYTDRNIQDTVSITGNNVASANASGGSIPASRDYPGIHRADLAARVLERDLASLSTAKVSGQGVFTRAAAGLHSGDVFKLTSVKHGLDAMVMRVLDVDEGDMRTNEVRVSFVQDKFSLPAQGIVVPGDRPWTEPVGVPIAASPRVVVEAPYYELARALGDDDAEAIFVNEPNAGYVFAAAGYGQGGGMGARVWVDAGSGYAQDQRIDFAPYGLATAVGKDPTETTITVSSARNLDAVDAGTLAYWGSEVVRVDAVADDVVTVGRGCLDTVPVAHDAGEAIVFYTDYQSGSTTEYVLSDVVNVKLRSRTGRGTLPLASAPVDTITMARRGVRPYPVGKLQLDGSYDPPYATVLTTGDLTWTSRNRLNQTGGAVIDFTGASITAETGTTYLVEVIALDGAGADLSPEVITTNVGALLTYAYDVSGWSYPSGTVSVAFRVTALRDGYASWQVPEIIVTAPGVVPLQSEAGVTLTSETGAILTAE